MFNNLLQFSNEGKSYFMAFSLYFLLLFIAMISLMMKYYHFCTLSKSISGKPFKVDEIRETLFFDLMELSLCSSYHVIS